MFRKKEDQFSVLLQQISENLVEATNYFADYTLKDENGVKEFAAKMKEYENIGDSFVHEIIHDLNKVFITPIEREDILSLAMHMDDVLDGLESTSAMFEMYTITASDTYMDQFMEAIQKAVIEMDAAIKLIVQKKLPQIRSHAIAVKDYESQCDDILRVSIKELFDKETNPIQLIKYKEIYEEFEEVADYCQNIDNMFEAIIIENSLVVFCYIDTVLLITILIVLFAVIFDFINGFHDTANAIATSVSTKALHPRHAILLAAVMNFLGAMTFTGVAQTIS